MQINGSKILVLGGWGLVGSAICHKLMEHNPSQIIVSSLNQIEAEDAVLQLRKEYPKSDPNMFIPLGGNIFTRKEWKDTSYATLLNEDVSRKGIIEDIFEELNDTILNRSTLYSFIEDSKPDIVIDCINTATAFAYLDIYNTSKKVIKEIKENRLATESVECLMTNMYVPQLIRHIQVLYHALVDFKTTLYLKIGTSGTGGMGLNIPYTHSEEKPSRVLLSKSAVAGAQTLLLFLMARTPNGPLIKEIKPTAAIAWKKIAYDKVIRKGKPIPLVDMTLDKAHEIGDSFKFSNSEGVSDTGEVYKSVFIDTGENGIFSKGEFRAIGALGQMEIVTPEEIATYAIHEILGGNSGRDVIQGLDAFTLGPTYRGGMLYNKALEKIEKLEKENEVDSVAFEMLGPPRLSKLLFEAYLIRRVAKTMKAFLELTPEFISKEALDIIKSDSKLRSEMLSIGLVILLPDGKSYLRGKDVKIPSFTGDDIIPLKNELVEKWCFEAWVDIRPSNFIHWQHYIQEIMANATEISDIDTSSRFTYTKEYWNNFDTIDEGKLVGWIFEIQEKGYRFKR